MPFCSDYDYIKTEKTKERLAYKSRVAQYHKLSNKSGRLAVNPMG